MEWIHKQGDVYVATGVDVAGKRFSIRSENWHRIRGINIYRGSRWLLRAGKRCLLQRIFN